MMDKVNGHPARQADQDLERGRAEVQAHAAAQASAQKALDDYVMTVVSTVSNGLVHSLPAVPGQIVLLSAARALGAVVGAMLQGEDEAVLPFRRAARECFTKAMHSVPTRPEAKPPATTDTAMPVDAVMRS